MFEQWKNYVIGIIGLLAVLGFLTLGEKFWGKTDTPDTTTQSIPPKPSTVMEKVRLRIRSEEDSELIKNVSVEFAVSNGSSFTGITGDDGYVDIEIPQGVEVKVRLKHKDYFPRNYTLNLSVEPNKTKDYFLKRKPKANLSSVLTSEPKPTISGVWEGTYKCYQGITGATVTIDQTGNDEVHAIFDFYPVSNNQNILSGKIEYKAEKFYSTSRFIRFPPGTWMDRPAITWTAFGFHGQFDENLEKFSGKMDHYSCGTINLTRKYS